MDAESASGVDAAIAAWLDRALPEYREFIHPAADYHDAPTPLLYELYALSRVSDLLHVLRHPEPKYLELFAALGITRAESPTFDPFLHEIAEVEPTASPDAPISLIEELTPALVLGDMLFCRAKVRVRAGALHAETGWADSFPLYWTFRREARPSVDLSHGWGHNSQWATFFRRDYRIDGCDHLNVDGFEDPATLRDDYEAEALLTPDERRTLVRHRTLLRRPAALAELGRSSPDWPSDLFPFDWSMQCSPAAGGAGDDGVDLEA